MLNVYNQSDQSTEGINWSGIRYVKTTRTDGYVKSRYSPRTPKQPETPTTGIIISDKVTR